MILIVGRNLSMLMDLYELTMGNGYLKNGLENKIVYFDMFFRRVPENGGYAVFSGLEQLIEYIESLEFTDNDILFLKKKNIFSDDFLEYLRNFSFSCDLWAVPEGTPVFPREPLVTVRGPVIEAQLIETMLLLILNHQSLIATKASRIVRAAGGRPVIELGSRRAQGADGAVYGARAAFIGGCCGTSCVMSERDFSVPSMGTMAHSWVQLFPSELEAFRAYAKIFPKNCTLLVDTYNVLGLGVPNAITVFKELAQAGYHNTAIRIDSGDIAYLSKKARKMLDDAGLNNCKIIASNSLDEHIISDLIAQGAKIDVFGVGESLITSRAEPVFGGVYKLTAVEENGMITPRIKLSENTAKVTDPGFKKPVRLFDRKTGMALADVVLLADEEIDDSRPYEIFDPEYPYKKKLIEDFYAKDLQVPVFRNGKCVYSKPSVHRIKEYCAEELAKIWDEVRRFENPHKYYVDLSPKLWKLKQGILSEFF
ncbi:MAG: nicotinate phosphoribosyltransferase [Clostridium sp.]|nr:nicotinate phosphoribosyltransferase [Clostridium sp.]MCM1547584.1 nicotinate phosphoribosyltransferase [Ruminococcus sp.]